MGEERGTKTVVLLLEAPYKDGGPQALAGAALTYHSATRPAPCSVVVATSSVSCPCHRPKLRPSTQVPPPIARTP
jgi:hypothetical protein